MSTVVPPVMTDESVQQFLNNFPKWALRNGRSVSVNVEVTIRPGGTPRSCFVTSIVGSDRLGHEICGATTRVEYHGATDPNGNPIYGRFRTTFVYLTRGAGAETRKVRDTIWPADFTIPMEDAPEDPKVFMGLAVLVGADGAIQACDSFVSEKLLPQAVQAPPGVLELACERAKAWPARPLLDESGQPVPYVTNLKVGFEKS